ncbi:MAG: AGE family epimerase/isomerase [Paludibacteraceae bacterium]|nr:AGE family epimerase/isomerase [Paludibacteraceae bacterium]
MTPTDLRRSAQQLLEQNILPYWWQQMRDPVGGFYGRRDGCNRLHADAERGAVMNARLLWAFSAAYRVLRKSEYLQAADWAKRYIQAHFLDPEFGGCYWSVMADGKPLDTKKQTYAQGFMLYAFSEYARATGDKQALQQAIQFYDVIERYACQFAEISDNTAAVHPLGYVEALTRDWQPTADMRLSDKDENAVFTMNTHLHLLEPYTNLYRVWHDEQLRWRLLDLLGIFINRLYNPVTHHVDCYFDANWQSKRDIVSYGHDIEAAWLMNEALRVLAEQSAVSNQSSTVTHQQSVIQNIAVASLEGLHTDGSLVHESADFSRQWWVECEAVIGYIDQWQITGDSVWLNRAEAVYRYSIEHLIDQANGEWFWAILPDGSVDRQNDKAGFWKCPYHNTRMCIELIERLQPLR